VSKTKIKSDWVSHTDAHSDTNGNSLSLSFTFRLTAHTHS